MVVFLVVGVYLSMTFDSSSAKISSTAIFETHFSNHKDISTVAADY